MSGFTCLTYDPYCDIGIKSELHRAKINIHKVNKHKGDVPYSIIGKLNGFEFRREWCYWKVVGTMPLKYAKILYKDPIGSTDIRADGNSNYSMPKKDVKYYHIDTGEGLRLFADIVRTIK